MSCLKIKNKYLRVKSMGSFPVSIAHFPVSSGWRVRGMELKMRYHKYVSTILILTMCTCRGARGDGWQKSEVIDRF